MKPGFVALAAACVLLAGCSGSGSGAGAIASPVASGANGGGTGATGSTGGISNAACAASYKPPVAANPGTAAGIVKQMGEGWNLGNTLDAYGDTANPLADEINWGNPLTSKAMIDAVHKAGFTTLRLPVSWDDHMSGAAHTIDPAWMDRVETVANYALADGMTVILNIHHNNGWEAPTLANEANAKDTLTRLWTQIAGRFAGYDQHLVFEVMNEPRAAVNGVDDWTGKAEYYDVLNRLNAAALAAIRATGGNNARRLVMLPSYAAGSGDPQLAAVVLPDDPMIAMSTHAYLPYDFAQNQQGGTVFNGQQELDALFARLNTHFIAKGIPVVLGEWASTDKNNAPERVKHASYFVKGAYAAGIPTVWWDNGNKTWTPTANDVMAIFDRSTLSWVHQDIVDAIFCAAQ